MKNILVIILYICSFTAFAKSELTSSSTDIHNGVIAKAANVFDEIIVCNGDYKITLLDAETGYTQKLLSHKIDHEILLPDEKKVFKVEIDLKRFTVESINEMTVFSCAKIKNDKEIKRIIRTLVLKGDKGNISKILSQLKRPEYFNYLSFGHTNLDLSLEEINELKFELNIDHIDFNNTPAQKRIFKNDPASRKCQVRKNIICGKEYIVKKSAKCGIAEYNSKASPLCGKIYNMQENENLCGCAKRTSNSLHCLDGCECIQANYCRREEFGLQEYKVCSLKQFGVKSYNKCEHPSHGVSRVKSCSLQVNENDQLELCDGDAAWDDIFNFNF